jgi:hypothetical protein
MPAEAQDIARVALTFEWSEDAARPLSGEHLPRADALAQLVYALNILYTETVEPGPERGASTAPHSRLQGIPAQWVRIATRLMVRNDPPGSEWPDALLAPRVSDAETLRIESIVMASPLIMVLAIPASAISVAGVWSVLKFVGAIEKAWNAPGRVALEKAKIDRDILRTLLETEQTKREHQRFAQDGFQLVEGTAQMPAGWEWPTAPGLSPG